MCARVQLRTRVDRQFSHVQNEKCTVRVRTATWQLTTVCYLVHFISHRQIHLFRMRENTKAFHSTNVSEACRIPKHACVCVCVYVLCSRVIGKRTSDRETMFMFVFVSPVRGGYTYILYMYPYMLAHFVFGLSLNEFFFNRSNVRKNVNAGKRKLCNCCERVNMCEVWDKYHVSRPLCWRWYQNSMLYSPRHNIFSICYEISCFSPHTIFRAWVIAALRSRNWFECVTFWWLLVWTETQENVHSALLQFICSEQILLGKKHIVIEPSNVGSNTEAQGIQINRKLCKLISATFLWSKWIINQLLFCCYCCFFLSARIFLSQQNLLAPCMHNSAVNNE